MPKIIKLLIAIVVCQLAGVIGSLFTAPAVANWYPTLDKPVFNPPDWLFAPVWTLLYLMMGIALYIFWQKAERGETKKLAIAFFTLQLVLNTLWSIIFFGLKLTWLAFAEIIILWIFIALTIKYFYRQQKLAAYLLVPYILWVSFAAVLNFAIAYLN